MKSLARRVGRWLRGKGAGTPAIRAHRFPRSEPSLHLSGVRSDEAQRLISQLCRFGTLDSAAFRGWAERLREPWQTHRKLWELAFICQALEERDMLRPGRRGLGFAVGAEKLPSFFASLGCTITATDLPTDDDRNRIWAETGQYVGNLTALNAAGLCDDAIFRERVTWRPVDMNAIPGDLRDFDFTWSTCSFEHCGSLALGLTFLERQMDCLRPGGVAVHTTEFNLSSNGATLETDTCVIYRLRDIEAICARLTALGHVVEPLDLNPGRHPLDHHIDEPPYCQWSVDPPHTVKHLRLNLCGYASTSIALVIRKAAA